MYKSKQNLTPLTIGPLSICVTDTVTEYHNKTKCHSTSETAKAKVEPYQRRIKYDEYTD